MRVPAPGPLKLDSQELLNDVRDRLASRLPEYAEGEADPTDPGWLLLEEAAWLVEVLSEQLDDYPYSVIQQLMHLIGGRLLPAKPACGVVIAEATIPGILRNERRKPSECRLFTPQNENNDVIEFVVVDSEVQLCTGRVVSLVEWDGQELGLIGEPGEIETGSIPGLISWSGGRKRTKLFDSEVAQFTVITNKVDDTLGYFEKAIEMLDGRTLGWLTLAVEQAGADRVRVDARIDLNLPFAESTPEGFTVGGDVWANWGTLDESTWTPPVHVQSHPLLPRVLRGTLPFPGQEENTIFIPDVPTNFPVAQLLQRTAAPIPGSVIDSIWGTLGNMNTRLAALRPNVRRIFEGEMEEDEPTWVAGALESGLWDHLVHGGSKAIAHIDGLNQNGKSKLVRLGLIMDAGRFGKDVDVEIYEVTSQGQIPNALLQKRVAWTLPSVLDRDGGRSVEVIGLDAKLHSSTRGVLVVVNGPMYGVMLNAMFVANMPAVDDGRDVTIQRNVPEPVSLLNEDLVDKEVIEHLLLEPIPKDAAKVLRELPVARLAVNGKEDIHDWEGTDIDPCSGVVTMNAPDNHGRRRDLRQGTGMTLSWYRRTDGSWGNVQAGGINIIELPPGSVPSISQVGNPLGTLFGEDRESPHAAVNRLFGPAGGTPVLPSDFEQLFRQALGSRASDWYIRVWSYAERALVTTALWPFGEGDEPRDDSTEKLRAALKTAGPESLLVVLGPLDKKMSDLEFEGAAAMIHKRVSQLRKRIPAVREAIVGRLWPLDLQVIDDDEDHTELPTHDTTGLQGELVDGKGRRGTPPPSTLMLNGVVTKVVQDEGGWS
ncbi:MAG: hypothetical protein HN348_00165 [Proteobacteria bacterium]|nr:hypothetical protein [Pseudomonadota bacterium]